MTRRERLERKLEKRMEWAEGRQAKADAGFRVGDEHRDASGRMDWALVTQPGHIPERARIIRAHDKACEHYQVARHHESKAAGLERQLESSIFSDDPDAVEALQARIAELETKRAAMKAENAAFKKGNEAWVRFRFPDADPLTVQQKMTEWAEPRRTEIMASYSWTRQPFPAYQLSNLGANIRRLKERIKAVQARQNRMAEAEHMGGLVITRHESANWCTVTFAEKPERQILEALKAAGFGWGSGSWSGPLDKLPQAVADLENSLTS